MKRTELIKELCKREGKKSQVSIANMREIVHHIEMLIAEDYYKCNARKIFADPRIGFMTATLDGVQRKLKSIWRKHDKEVKKLLKK